MAILQKTTNTVQWTFWGPSFTNKNIFKLSFLSGRILFAWYSPSEVVNVKLLMISMVALRNLLRIPEVWIFFFIV